MKKLALEEGAAESKEKLWKHSGTKNKWRIAMQQGLLGRWALQPRLVEKLGTKKGRRHEYQSCGR